MKKWVLIVLVFVAAISSTLAFAADSGSTKIIAYYFHGSFRCYTCNNMEKYSQEALQTYFKDVLDSGKLEFKAVNVEDRGNEHFVDEYQLYTKALILSLVQDGKEVRSKNLDKIWKLARNKQKFFEYVAEEMNAFMTGAQ